MHRFFLNEENFKDDTFFLYDEDFHHIKNVLRLKQKDNIEIIYNNMIYICTNLTFNSDNLSVSIISKDKLLLESPNIHLYQGLAKSDKFDYIVQKSVELGVTEITPLLTNRVIVKLNGKKSDRKIERYKKISKSAASQSKRSIIPTVNNPLQIDELFLDKNELGLIAYENSSNYNLKKILKSSTVNNIKIVIGPEGGFEKYEVEELMDKGFKSISLGKRILRTETAPLNLISVIQYELGDM